MLVLDLDLLELDLDLLVLEPDFTLELLDLFVAVLLLDFTTPSEDDAGATELLEVLQSP